MTNVSSKHASSALHCFSKIRYENRTLLRHFVDKSLNSLELDWISIEVTGLE